jgi:phosphoribosylformimino-5-aminoimidazole carboxamide ribotide isomerase
VQLGGGIRDLDTIERYLDDGISYVIIGTAAVKNPGFLQDACTRLPAATSSSGSTRKRRQGGHRRLEQAHRPRRASTSPASSRTTASRRVIYTDIGRDGMLIGINIEATVKLAQALSHPASSPPAACPASLDIERLCAVEAEGIAGADLRAARIYDGSARLRAPRRRAPTSSAPERHAPRCWPSASSPAWTSTGGRVVKGVNFVELRDAGDPVEIARALQRAGRRRADLPRHHRHHRRPRPHPAHHRGGGLAGLHPAHRGRRRAHGRADVRRLLNAGADKVELQLRGRGRPAAHRARPRSATARSASWWPSMPSAEGDDCWRAAGLGRLHPRRPRATPGSTPWHWAQPMADAGRRRDPAHQHGPRRHEDRLRPRADARGEPTRCRCR